MPSTKSNQSKEVPSGQAVQGLSTWLTYAALVVLAGLAWIALIFQSSTSSVEAAMDMVPNSSFPRLTLLEAGKFLVSWGVMMAAMMLPSALPMLALYGSTRSNFIRKGHKAIPTTAFTGVYLAVWAGFGLPVYFAWVAIGTISEMNMFVSSLLPYALALVLIAAGIYQFSPLKQVCLRACRSPLAFLLGNWNNGYRGTFRLALRHALYCLGCCWALMVVLVAAGAMALHWVLLLAVLVLAEKILPQSRWTVRLIGGALIILGLAVGLVPELASILRGQMTAM
jgi:predicted metal-binding membrane protein